MKDETCVDCGEPITRGKLTERGTVCANCANVPNDPRVDERALRASRNDRLSRDRTRDERQGRPV
jgi:hypothetical protein